MPTRAIMPPQGRATERSRTLLRQLAELEPSDTPVLSASVDLRPQADAADPASREARVLLRNRLREELDSLTPHEPAHDSLTADTERVQTLVEERSAPNEPDDGPAARGLLAYACNGSGLWETYLTQAQLENEVDVGPRPRLTPLARLAAFQPAVVAIFDTNSLRLFAARPGRLVEIPGLDDPPDDYTQTGQGGWSQGRYERHVDEQRDAFARRMAERITALIEREGDARLVFGGDEVAVPTLQGVLPGTLADNVGATIKIGLRSTLEEIEEEVFPVLAAMADERTTDAADRLVGAARGDGLGVGGLQETGKALELGAALEVLVDETAVEGEALEDVIRLAALTDAPVTFVTGHEELLSLGGVGALLRFKP
jgi:peptide chain release factor subunit 1